MDVASSSIFATKSNPDKILRVARSKRYPDEIWWCIACIIFTVALFNRGSWVISHLVARYGSTAVSDAEGGRASAPRHFSLRRLPLAIVNAYRVIAFRWTLNIGSSFTLNVAEVAVTCGYIITLFTWDLINTTDVSGHKFDIKYWDNRAGTIAASQLPLIVALSMKNNIISLITGLSYVHRMAARVLFVLVWKRLILDFVPLDLHTRTRGMGAGMLFGFGRGDHVYHLDSDFPPSNPGAGVRVFLFVHFILVFILLLSCYFHADNFSANGFYFGTYVWPSFLFWGLDRFIRFIRVVVFNHLYFAFSSKANALDATVELLSPHFVRLRLSRPPHFHWAPGQTAFLTVPSASTFPLESHPFTISSVDTTLCFGAREPAGDLEKTDLGETVPYWKELVFLVKVREGFTKSLAKAAQSGKKVKVFVDGPYGFSPDLSCDDSVVLIAGGSGVSYTLAIFLGILDKAHNNSTKCRKVVFVWMIRDATHIEWVSKTLSKALEIAPSHLEISIRLYVTAGEPLPASNPSAWDDDSVHSISEGTAVGKSRPSSLLSFSAVQVMQGRPDLRALLRDEVAVNTGRLSVTVCGSQSIARACRAALRLSPSVALNGGPSVFLHVESFGYADP
ncbi:Ferric/cupric reductase transmembrane component 1 [Grifola frondosa]|uniref:ferric-chelate reductase (NADPH) n=1 Tax=Grifola frondosa TaxID=5627 RepID=A0A1C7MME7_GRIFR|nr:Ferric/cupric reductase transmembrane component 1 [Grifola frondosa]